MKLGISIFPEDLGYDGAVAVGRRADEKGLAEVFTVEHGFYNDGVITAMAIAAKTERIAVGTGIANVYLRHPYSLANAALAMHRIAGGGFVLGIGVGHPHLAKALEVPWAPPRQALRETTEKVRAAFADAPEGAAAGRTFMDATPDIPVHWGGVGERTVRGAVNHADGLMLYLCSGARLDDIFAMVADEMKSAGRDPASLDVSLLIPTFLDTDLARSRAAGREFLILYCSFPAYARMFRASGFADEQDAIDARLAAGDRAGAKAAIGDAMLDEVCLVGDAERIARGLQRLADRGLSHALIAPRALDPATTRADMLRTVDAVAELTVGRGVRAGRAGRWRARTG